jgi:lysyl-tRNA synthetase class 2
MHNPEFTMLEFYIAYYEYNDLMNLTEELITGIATKVLGKEELDFGGKKISLSRPWPRMTMKQALIEIGKIPPSRLQEVDALRAFGEDAKVKDASTLSRGRLWGELFEALVEEHLWNPVFITDYPRDLSPLSKSKPEDPDFVERFELYVAGMEIANGYSELNDPVEQRRRFEEQMLAFESGDQEAHSMDEEYLTALEHGMPPTGGEGIGIDRLTMLFTNSRSIREVILFPLLKPK